MQKISTPLKKTDLFPEKKTLAIMKELEPSEKTLQNILQFAATYKSQKVIENQFVEWFLN